MQVCLLACSLTLSLPPSPSPSPSLSLPLSSLTLSLPPSLYTLHLQDFMYTHQCDSLPAKNSNQDRNEDLHWLLIFFLAGLVASS